MKLLWILYLLHRVSDSYLVPWFLKKKKRDEELQRWDEHLDSMLEVGSMNYETFVDLIFTPLCF